MMDSRLVWPLDTLFQLGKNLKGWCVRANYWRPAGGQRISPCQVTRLCWIAWLCARSMYTRNAPPTLYLVIQKQRGAGCNSNEACFCSFQGFQWFVFFRRGNFVSVCLPNADNLQSHVVVGHELRFFLVIIINIYIVTLRVLQYYGVSSQTRHMAFFLDAVLCFMDKPFVCRVYMHCIVCTVSNIICLK